eukprot:m.9034 g.9034  ORF g.9034 m.9034 type:complete len:140 (+) comp3996_c0_seq1:88-507(+)
MAEKPEKLLRMALQTGVLYFISMATAHFTSFKVPLLFVYYDVPFYAYQDSIIAFCVLTYCLLFIAASEHRVIVPYALACMFFTTVGLMNVNLHSDLQKAIGEGNSTMNYWIQTAGVGFYGAVLFYLYLTQEQREGKKSK